MENALDYFAKYSIIKLKTEKSSYYLSELFIELWEISTKIALKDQTYSFFLL